jgi:Ca2+-binding EF-hand superfamily protein
MFRQFDTNADGVISPAELRGGYAQFGVTMTDSDFQLIWSFIDSGNKGYFDLNDVCQTYVPGRYPNSLMTSLWGKKKAAATRKCASGDQFTQAATESFVGLYDTNGDGVITAAEYATATNIDVASAGYALSYLGGSNNQLTFQ